MPPASLDLAGNAACRSVRSNVTDASGSSARSSPPKYSVDQADAVRGGWGFLATVEQQTNNLHRLRLARIQ